MGAQHEAVGWSASVDERARLGDDSREKTRDDVAEREGGVTQALNFSTSSEDLHLPGKEVQQPVGSERAGHSTLCKIPS